MSAYRSPGPLAKLPPRAPWWRLLRAALDGTLLRLRGRRERYLLGIVRDPLAWRKVFADEEIDRHLPPSLHKRPPPKGPGARPANIPE